MKIAFLTPLHSRWQAILGWVVFLGLVAALLTGHYVFDPFIFGFAYYAIYVITRFGKAEERANRSLMEHRLMALCVIALLYLWIALRHNVDERSFIAKFERTCYRSSLVSTDLKKQLCEEIQSHIDATFRKETDFSGE